MKVGYIGAGAMGALMIARLAKAYPGKMHVHDVSLEVTDRVAKETGAIACGTIAEIAAKSDVLLSCIPNNDSVHQVYLGEGGVVSAIQDGSITIDCSTVGPEITQEVCKSLATRGASHLDASMLGSIKQATEGTISFVVGGDEEAFERAKPVLAHCGELIRHCGPSGAGNHMKLIHQTLVAGHAVTVAEAMGLCLETGADIETFFDIVTQGTGFAHSRYFENRVPRMRDGEFDALFMLKFMLKDIRLAREMISDAPNRYPTLDSNVKCFEDCVDNDWGDDDFSAVIKLVETRIGKSISKQ